jgi:serine/threonine-protein kinase
VTQGGSSTAAGVREGDILAGKYRVERVLGIGGMGVVVAAHHMHLDEKVAIKFLLPHMLANPEAVGRFAREARAAVKIKSEHVARVFDVGTLETGAPYMVMEFLDGGDLADWLKQRGALAFDQAVEFVLQACVAVAEAHGLGIVHRDLKPANLFCIRRADGQLSIKVLDFGISKVATAGASAPEMSMTATSAMMGSPLYMSPEQMESSKNVDRRTDVWALGVILYELLARTTPFEGDSMPSLCMKIASQPPPPLATYRPGAPPGLEAVILRCLEKDRERRYPNVAELALALLPFAPKRARASVERISGIIQSSGLSATALSVPPSPGAPSPPSAGTMGPFGVTAPGKAGRKTAIGLIGGVVALCVVAVVLVAARHPASAPPTDADKPVVAAVKRPAPAEVSPVVLPSPPPLAELPALAPAPEAPATTSAKVSTPPAAVPKMAPARPVAAAKASVATASPAPPPPSPPARPAPASPAYVDPLANLQPKK